MAGARLSHQEMRDVLALVDAHQGNVLGASRASGIPRGTLQARYYRANQRRAEFQPKTDARDYEDAWHTWNQAIGKTKERYKGPNTRVTTGERVKYVVFGDPHCPFQETELIEEIIRREKGADVAIVMGDSLDGYSVSRYVPYERVPIEREIAAADVFYGRLSEAFGTVKAIHGNHDDRLEKMVREKLSVDAVTALLTLTGGHFDLVKVVTANKPNVQIIGHRAQGRSMGWLAQEGDAIFSHAEKFSRVPGAVMRSVDEWLRDNHDMLGLAPWRVLFQAHTHQLGLFPWEASKVLVEVGCLCQVPGYAMTARVGGRPQRRGYVTFEQVNGVTDVNSIRITWFDGQALQNRSPR